MISFEVDESIHSFRSSFALKLLTIIFMILLSLDFIDHDSTNFSSFASSDEQIPKTSADSECE